MSVPTKVLCILPVALALSSCLRANVTPYNTGPPRPAQEVAVFTERTPDWSFEEVGLIEVTGGSDYGKLVARAREEAAKLGAEAIIVSRRPIEGALFLPPDEDDMMPMGMVSGMAHRVIRGGPGSSSRDSASESTPLLDKFGRPSGLVYVAPSDGGSLGSTRGSG